MKIEKINEEQIKIFLTQDDLEERNIKISEFAYCSEKAQNLFRDMMEKASDEFGFYVDANRFIIEAIPSSLDSIILIITKVSDNESILDKLGLYRNTRNLNKINSLVYNHNENVCVYRFKTLDVICAAASRLVCSSNNSLFKYKNVYYLVIDTSDEDNTAYISSVLNEYGTKQNASELSPYFFLEHGETIIKDNAISVLAKI